MINKQRIVANLRKNKIIRFLAFPIENYNRKLLKNKYLQSDDYKYIKSLKDKYSDERCFVLGNGPSLLPSDLDKLINEYTFGSNRIYHIFDRTKWKPTFYICSDNDGIRYEIDRIKQCGDFEKFLPYKSITYGRINKDNINYFLIDAKFELDKYKFMPVVNKSDNSVFFSQFQTVTCNAIELAIHMGFKEIYLLGVDNNYSKKIDENGKIYKDKNFSSESSYFAGMKDCSGNKGDGISAQNVEGMNNSYKAIKEFASKKGVKIYNATRGGKLEIFPRIDFDKLILK